MRYRPHLPDYKIASLLADRFGLDGVKLIFLPVGEDGWAYRAETEESRSWFVKLNQHMPAASLAMTAYLCSAVGLDWIPAPHPAVDGSLWAQCEGLYLTVHPFVEGGILIDQPVQPDQAVRIGHMLAELHQADQRLPGELRAQLPAETYRRHQETAALVLAAGLSGAAGDKTQRELSGFIRSHRQLIEQVITHNRELGEKIRLSLPPAVLCHADIHAANIIADLAGRLWVIDWDGVMLAPRERDLMFWCHTPVWSDIAAGYGLNDPLVAELVRYYEYEWVVQEIADYGENVYLLPLSANQKQDSLAEFITLFEPGNVVESALNS